MRVVDDGVMMAWASCKNTLGMGVGRPYTVKRDEPAVAMEVPGLASEARFGSDAAIVGDGDGHTDLVVGARLQSEPTPGRYAGAAFLYRGRADGSFENSPALTLGGFTGHFARDELGYAVAGIGDFDGDGRPDFALGARKAERPDELDESFLEDGDCAARMNDQGAVWIFRGRDGLPDPTPSFVYYGPRAGAQLEGIAGGADVNADGWDDMVVGHPLMDTEVGGGDAGGFSVVFGRAAVEGRVVVLCEAGLVVYGEEGAAQLGHAATMIGDVTDDGCAELAVGAWRETIGGPVRQGSVRVVFGFGSEQCGLVARYALLASGEANSEAGFSLSAADLDGDDLPDLAVGMPSLTVANHRGGGGRIVSGSHLRGLPRQRFDEPPVAHPMESDPNWRFLGEQFGARFGHAVAAFPGHIVVGGNSYDWAPRGRGNGVGGVWIHELGPDGPVQEPLVVVVGETWWPASLFGSVVHAGPAGDGFAIVVATYQGAASAPDSGSAYTWFFGN